MPEDNPTLAELGITGRAAKALTIAGLTDRRSIEAFGLGALEHIKGIGDDYAADIRDAVAASYPSNAEVRTYLEALEPREGCGRLRSILLSKWPKKDVRPKYIRP